MTAPCTFRKETQRCDFDKKLNRVSGGGFMGHTCSFTIEEACELARQELIKATRKHGPMAGAHEGYAVILEELDELWHEVKQQNRDKDALVKEALHTAAMALRFVVDVCKA